jgi:hypothetical protein
MELRKPRITPETKVKVIADYNSNMKVADILIRNKISLRTLYRIIKEKV